MLKNLAIALFAVFLLASCSDKKKPSLSGDEPVEAEDFVNSFELVKPTYEITDTLLARKEKDSLLISNKIFSQFVPDSVLSKIFGKNVKPKLYLMKRVEVEKQESYLFTKAIHSDKKAIIILCFDNENKFLAAMPLMKDDGNALTTQVCGIDRKFQIYRSTFLKKNDGTTGEGKEVYIFNVDAGQFILIMTEALDDRIKEVINPIDTLGRNNKFSADYVKDKMNIVSIRDGGKPDKLNFFIHFEKNNGECTGELKGIAMLNKNNIATYKQAADACVIQFNFTSSSVSIKELEPCGSHRGVKCSFDGTYPRKKEKKTTRSAVGKKLSKIII